MTNSTFHKLCYEFDLNYRVQDDFASYCDNLGIMHTDSYGIITANTTDMKLARDYWKKTTKIWLKNCVEEDVYIDSMPFGGYKSHKDAQKVLTDYRKNHK